MFWACPKMVDVIKELSLRRYDSGVICMSRKCKSLNLIEAKEMCKVAENVWHVRKSHGLDNYKLYGRVSVGYTPSYDRSVEKTNLQ